MPRQSAAVYRRRRLMVLLALLLVLAVIGVAIWAAIAQPWASAPGSSPTVSASHPTTTPEERRTPDAEKSPDATAPEKTPDASPTPAKIVACKAADIEVVAKTDADTYGAGQLPKLSIALTNNGEQDCTLDVGSSTQKFTITSGSDTWWRSTDCQSEPSSLIATLKAGETVVSAKPVVWDRTRSSVDTCKDKNRPRAPGGGASYHVTVEIGGFESVQPKQFLLN